MNDSSSLSFFSFQYVFRSLSYVCFVSELVCFFNEFQFCEWCLQKLQLNSPNFTIFTNFSFTFALETYLFLEMWFYPQTLFTLISVFLFATLKKEKKLSTEKKTERKTTWKDENFSLVYKSVIFKTTIYLVLFPTLSKYWTKKVKQKL